MSSLALQELDGKEIRTGGTAPLPAGRVPGNPYEGPESARIPHGREAIYVTPM
jgi:hypothetical protein